MLNNKTTGLPIFFNYKEENTDNGYETIQDFFLSWTLRCADKRYRNNNFILNEYARRMVHALIYGENSENGGYILAKEISDDFRVLKVKTKRQWNQVDLLAEVDVEEQLIKSKYVLNIENKWYSSIKDGQLEKSKRFVSCKYADKAKIASLVIFCDYEKIDEETQNICKENGYKLLAITDIQEITKMKGGKETGNDLYDEFWFNL